MPNFERFDFTSGVWTTADPTARSQRTLSKENDQRQELDAPSNSPREGRWHGTRNDSRASRTYALSLAATFLPFLCALPFQNEWLVLLAGIPLIGGKPILVGIYAKREKKAFETDFRMLEDVGEATQCLVEVTIFQGGSPVGTDRGVALFSESKLTFAGRAMSFAIGGEDLLPRTQWSEDYSDVSLRGIYIPLRTERKRDFIRVLPLGGDQGFYRQVGLFERRVSRFRDEPTQSDGLHRQWPPFVDRVRTRAIARLRNRPFITRARKEQMRVVVCLALVFGAMFAIASLHQPPPDEPENTRSDQSAIPPSPDSVPVDED